MIRGERELYVERPAEAVFDYLADLRNLREWNRRAVRVERLDAGPIAAGSRFRSRHRHAGWLETEILSYQRPERLLLLARGRRLDLLVELQFEPREPGVALRIRLEVRPHRVWRLLAPVILPRFRRENPLLLAELKRVLELHAGADAAE
ncbi:MAG TPA: SRPBCC family protein [Dehalococcoidia bacterium]|nr:SRPBCC family protein [Dehalococcoidia bacterium]